MTQKTKWLGEPSPWVFTLVETASKDETQRATALTSARSMLSSRPENPADEVWLRIVVGRYATEVGTRITAYERAYELATEHSIRLPRIEAGVALLNLYKEAGRNEDASKLLSDLGDSAKEALASGAELLAGKTKGLVGQGLLVLGQYLTEAGRLATTKVDPPSEKPTDKPAE